MNRRSSSLIVALMLIGSLLGGCSPTDSPSAPPEQASNSISDAGITVSVKLALAVERGVKASEINVDTDHGTTYSFDFHYDFTKAASYTLWAGGGPTLIHRDFDASAPADNVDSTDPGVNLLFGVGGTEGKVRPYGQFKVIVADDPAAVAAVGIRF